MEWRFGPHVDGDFYLTHERSAISKVVRAAIYRHIATRRADKRFQEKLKERLEEDLKTLEQLSG